VIRERDINVGTVYLNNEYKQNILTIGFMADIRRCLESMEIDESIKSVILKSRKQDVFSFGSDLNTLYYRKKNKEYELIDKYYEQLYNFQHFLASYHKPLIAIGTGISSKVLF
jgi:enoyl-CoA hydratase